MDAMVIDPGFKEGECTEILSEISAHNLKVKYIVNTHGHPDHTSCNGMLKRATDAEILIHEKEAYCLTDPWKDTLKMLEDQKFKICPRCDKEALKFEILENEGKGALMCDVCGVFLEIIVSPPADRLLRHGDVIKVGQLEFGVIHTPGHSEGGISLYSERENAVFSGSTLFRNSIARTDLPGSSRDVLMQSLRDKLMKLPENTIVYPGHGEVTTIGSEKRENPNLQT
jgi:glyoxylase-like metal-dependent hydrolase (beta-lactamase superfamily II)